MTFRAYGSSRIQDATGLSLDLSNVEVNPALLTKTVEANGSFTDATDGSSTTIALPDTLGISGGNAISYTGEGVDNSSTNKVTTVTPDPNGGGNDGKIVVQAAQELKVGTVLTFLNVHKLITLTGSININKYSTANHTINLDLDKIITLGVRTTS